MNRTAFAARVLAMTILAMATSVAAAFAWMWGYATFVQPGLPDSSYTAIAREHAPWIAVTLGVGIVGVAGWLLARWTGGGWRHGIWVGILYAVLDGIIIAIVADVTAIMLLSWASKISAAAIGGYIARPSAP